jgi:hypothetical protein
MITMKGMGHVIPHELINEFVTLITTHCNRFLG